MEQVVLVALCGYISGEYKTYDETTAENQHIDRAGFAFLNSLLPNYLCFS